MKLIYSKEFFESLDNIYEYLESKNKIAAQTTIANIEDSCKSLKLFPYIGRIGRVKDTRELIITRTNFIVAYSVKNEMIEILDILHSAREWPDNFTIH